MNDSGKQRSVWLEAWLLGVLAITPLAAHLAYYWAHPIGRYSVGGDFALIELAAKRAWTGEILLGPYSRFRFSHPGPLYFYLLAPLYALFPSSTTIHVGAALLNGVAALATVVALRVFSSRAYAITFAVGLLAFFSAFGNAASNPWNPLVIALPLLALFAFAALLSEGAVTLAVPVAVLAVLVSQTHLAVLPVAAVTVATSYGITAYRTRGSESFARTRRQLLAGVVVGFVLYLPPLVEQLTSPEGNLSKLVRFFLHREGPAKSLKEAVIHWATATGWLPERAFQGALLRDGWPPLPMRWDAMPTTLTRGELARALAYVILLFAALAMARKRRDTIGVALLTAALGANALAILALRGVVGETFYYLVFWTTAGSTLGWLAIVGTAAQALVSSMTRTWSGIRQYAPFALLGLAMEAWVCAREQQAFIAATPLGGSPVDWFRAAHDAVRARADVEGRTPIIHLDGQWWGAKALMLELVKDGIDVRPAESDRWVFGRVAHAAAVARPLHVYLDSPDLPLPNIHGLEKVDLPNGNHMYFATEEVPMPPR